LFVPKLIETETGNEVRTIIRQVHLAVKSKRESFFMPI